MRSLSMEEILLVVLMIVEKILYFGLCSMELHRIRPKFTNIYVIHDHSKRPYITFYAVNRFFLENQLRCHIQYCSHTCSISLIIFFSQLLSKSKISQFYYISLDQNILSLDISMSDVFIIKLACS